MAARLYPGFGSGRGKFEGSFEVRSLKAGGFPQLEAGDKVILPAAAFKEISRLKLPFPMIFRVENERRRSAGRVANRRGATKAPVKQFCGVQEFSAEKGKAFLPRWMMQNLKIRDGGRAVFTSVRGMPKGTFVRFQPHTTEFIDLAAALGPRELMEHAMKTYSALSLGETLVVQCSGSMFKLDVLEVRPGPKDDPPNPHSAICLYGDLDLEADFAPAKDTEKASTPAAGSITPMSQGELDDLAGQALAAAQAAATPAEEAPGSAAFSGTGHTLGGGGNRRGDRGTAGSGAGAGPRPSSAKRLRSAVAASRHRATARPMSPIESSPMPTPTTDAKRRPRRAAGTSTTTPSSSRTPRRQAGKRQGTGGKGSAVGKGGRTHAAEPAPASPGFRASRATAAPPVAPQASFGLGFFSGTWRGLDLGTPPRGMSRAQREAAGQLASTVDPSALFMSPGRKAAQPESSAPAMGSTLPRSMPLTGGDRAGPGAAFAAAGMGRSLVSPAPAPGHSASATVSPITTGGQAGRPSPGAGMTLGRGDSATKGAGRSVLLDRYGTPPRRAVQGVGGAAESKWGEASPGGGRVSPIQSPATHAGSRTAAAAGRSLRRSRHK